MERTLRSLVQIYSDYEIWFIGHSLGGAKAEMSVVSVLLKKLVSQNKVRLLTFGATRVGDMSFVNLIEALVPYRFRVIHGRDMVPRYPRKFDGEWTPPHHHRYEVWYPEGMGIGAKYFVCLGAEDPQCSSRLSPWEIRASDNDIYFERSMQHWARSFCDDGIMYPKSQPTQFGNIREPVYDMTSIRTTYPTPATIPATSAHPIITNARLFPEDLPTIPFDGTTKKATTTESIQSTTPILVRTTKTSRMPSKTLFRTPPTTSTTPSTTHARNVLEEKLWNVTSIANSSRSGTRSWLYR
ncbi:hypothetical protein GCK32_011804 [Trichostrongylus colubriformis]|uniref:Fungal lipase-type domain-containing protein n=1 Tax=Trichostrongylus colubriformis TaxID=6319 RepID=A0AAN8FZS2_TRICO